MFYKSLILMQILYYVDGYCFHSIEKCLAKNTWELPFMFAVRTPWLVKVLSGPVYMEGVPR